MNKVASRGIALLIESRRPGSTSWAAVRGRSRILVHGAQKEDTVILFFRDRNGKELSYEYECNGADEIQAPEGVYAMRVEHRRASGSKVTVEVL